MIKFLLHSVVRLTFMMLLATWSDPSAFCQSSEPVNPIITITSAPTNAPGDFFVENNIKGTVAGIKPDQCKVVVFAFDNDGQNWWIQPYTNYLIGVRANNTWESPTRGGNKFAALLVNTSFKFPVNNPIKIPPSIGGAIYDVTYKNGAPTRK